MSRGRQDKCNQLLESEANRRNLYILIETVSVPSASDANCDRRTALREGNVAVGAACLQGAHDANFGERGQRAFYQNMIIGD